MYCFVFFSDTPLGQIHRCCLRPPVDHTQGWLNHMHLSSASGVKSQTTICRFNGSIMHLRALRCQSEAIVFPVWFVLLVFAYIVASGGHHLHLIGNHSVGQVVPIARAGGPTKVLIWAADTTCMVVNKCNRQSTDCRGGFLILSFLG